MTGADGRGTCTNCGDDRLEPGFVSDTGQRAPGFGRWIAGALERGPLGHARMRGRQRRAIQAFRCARCGHLELFARDVV